MPEIYSPTLEISKIDKPDKPISIDEIDKTVKRLGSLATSFAVVVAASANSIASHYGVEGTYLWYIPVAAYHFFRIIELPVIIRKNDKKQQLEDGQLGFRLDRCVYKGKEPLEVGGQTFTKGDNFFYFQLPKTNLLENQDMKLPQEAGCWLDLYDYSIRTAREFMSGKNYKFVAMDVSTDGILPHRLPEPVLETKTKTLFSGKQARVKDGEKTVVMVTKEEFEGLTVSPQEMFKKAAEALNDKMFSDLLSHVAKATTMTEREKLKDLLQRRLSLVITSEVESHFNSVPEVVIERTGEQYAPVKKKIYHRSLIKKTDSGLFFVQVNTANGEMQWIPLNKLLKTHHEPIEAIMSSRSPLMRSQLAYILYQTISETPIEELIRERSISKEEILAEFEKLKQDKPKATQAVTSMFKFVPPWDLVPKARTLLAVLMVSAGMQVGLSAKFSPEKIQEVLSPTPIVQEINKLQFPEKLPPVGLDWKIEGTMPINGYYITGTSAEFANGTWQINEEIKRKIDQLPQWYTSYRTPYLELSRIQAVNAFGDTVFRVPIRENTEVRALRIVDQNDNNVDADIFELTDGTVKVVIPWNINRPGWVNVVVKLYPTKNTPVHATKLMNPIDESLLTEKVKGQLSEARKEYNADFPEAVFEIVRNSHLYSLDPPDKDKLLVAKGPEQIVNTIADLSGCSCEVCNTAAVLLVSTNTNSPPINIAFGYVSSGNQSEGVNGGFIRKERYHAFGVGEYGEILDATPSVLATDKLTQDYMGILNNPDRDGGNWEQEQEMVKYKAEQQKKIIESLKLFGSAVIGSVGVLASLQINRWLKRVTKEDVSNLADGAFLGLFSKRELELAEQFFEWLSWGHKGSSLPESDKISQDDKVEVLSEIRNNVNYEKLDAYVQDPKPLERAIRSKGLALGSGEVIKIRMLAKYLLSA